MLTWGKTYTQDEKTVDVTKGRGLGYYAVSQGDTVQLRHLIYPVGVFDGLEAAKDAAEIHNRIGRIKKLDPERRRYPRTSAGVSAGGANFSFVPHPPEGETEYFTLQIHVLDPVTCHLDHEWHLPEHHATMPEALHFVADGYASMRDLLKVLLTYDV